MLQSHLNQPPTLAPLHFVRGGQAQRAATLLNQRGAMLMLTGPGPPSPELLYIILYSCSKKLHNLVSICLW